QLLLRAGDDCVHQSVDGLVLRLGDVGERLAALELRAKLRLRQAEIARRGIDARSEHVERAVHAEAGAAEEREVAGLDVLLQLITLGFWQPTRGDGGVDPVLERLLERRAERAGRDAELLRRVVHHRLALLLRRAAELVGGERRPTTGDRETGDRACDQPWSEPACHRVLLSWFALRSEPPRCEIRLRAP